MSKGKYSPTITRVMADREFDEFCFNACGKIPPEFSHSAYNEKVHFANYDAEGYDRYGYSAFDADGVYVGIGDGVDRNDITEYEYSVMEDEEFEQY